jgi:hypothetical protein
MVRGPLGREVGWERIRVEVGGADDPCREEGIYGALGSEGNERGGDVYLRGFSCLWRLPDGASEAARVRLPRGAELRQVDMLGSSLYILVEQKGRGMLLRRR